jgi:two-component system chemotaxis sensor kinase CheA
MSVTESELEEFKTEALELLDLGEKSLLSLDIGGDFKSSFDSIFRAFHNLKGSAGMMELHLLQQHTHELESILMRFKEEAMIPKSYVDMFLRGIDGARAILDNQTITFDFNVETSEPPHTAATQPHEAPSPVAPTPITQSLDAPAPLASAPQTAPSPIFGTSLDECMTELEEAMTRFQTHLRALEGGSAPAETINDAYREMHSLKGAAYLFGFDDIGQIAHAMESALEPVRDGTQKLSPLLIDGLYKALDCIELSIGFMKKNLPNEQIKTLAPAIIKILNRASQFISGHDAPSSAVSPHLSDVSSDLIVSTESDAPQEPIVSVSPVVPVAPVHVPAASAVPSEQPVLASAPNFASSTGQPTVTSSAPAPAAAPGHETNDQTSSIRVPVSLLDNLMNLMGEMVLVRNQVLQFSSRSEDLEFLNLSQRLNVVTSEIQGEMMKTRMQPIGNVLSKFHRVVRDLSMELGKSITLTLTGSETELDKSLLETIKDPLTHIVRNSCDHGVESIEQRRATGIAETGSIVINSYHEGGQVVIEIADDGKGLNRATLLKKGVEKGLVTDLQSRQMSDAEVYKLIFAPGFSTAAKVTNVSGRGVGMDVVRTNVEKIGGTIDLSSREGQGTTIRLKIPLTLAIVPALLVRGERGSFAIPQVKLVELVCVERNSENKIEKLQGAPVLRLRGQLLPLVDLNTVLDSSGSVSELNLSERSMTNIAVLNAGAFSFGLIIDEIQDSADIVVKPMSGILKSLQIYSGATILGDGSVALIIDVQGLARLAAVKAETESNAAVKLKESAESLGQMSEIQDFLLLKLN